MNTQIRTYPKQIWILNKKSLSFKYFNNRSNSSVEKYTKKKKKRFMSFKMECPPKGQNRGRKDFNPSTTII